MWFVGVGFVVMFVIINIIGIKVFSKFEIVLMVGMWLLLMIFGIFGFVVVLVVYFDGWFGGLEVGMLILVVLLLVGMVMFMFVGCEFVMLFVLEMKVLGCMILCVMVFGFVGVVICMFLYGVVICC